MTSVISRSPDSLRTGSARRLLVPGLATLTVLAMGCGRIGYDNQALDTTSHDAATETAVDADLGQQLDAATAACVDETDCPAVSLGPALVVAANANLYGAGHAMAPEPGGGGAGVLPPFVVLPPGTGRLMLLTGVAGAIDIFGGAPSEGPDGIPTSEIREAGFGGLSGYWARANGAMSAVFLDDAEPTDPAPADLDCGNLSYGTLAPALNQVFVIGDGLTGTASGEPQVIAVPDGATRVFFGISDSSGGDALPGAYGDNNGSFTVVGEAFVPAP